MISRLSWPRVATLAGALGWLLAPSIVLGQPPAPDADDQPQQSPETAAGSDADADTDTDTDADADTEADTDTNTDTNADTDSDTDTELSAEELAAIQAATSADAAAADTSTASSSSDAPATGGGGAFGFLQSMNPDLSFIADVALAWFSDDESQLQTGDHDPTTNGFNLQQLELSVMANVDPYFKVAGNIVFGADGVEIEEIYGTTLDLPGQLQIRAGQFLTRIGRTNPTHPHTWYFVDQPFAIGRIFGSDGNRGLGAEVSWLTPLPWYVEVVGSATQANGEGTARSFYGEDDLGVRTPLDLEYVLSLKSFHPLSDDWSFFWGVSGAFGPNGTGRDNRTDIYAGDVYLKWRPITEASYAMSRSRAKRSTAGARCRPTSSTTGRCTRASSSVSRSAGRSPPATSSARRRNR